jgi:trimethylamine--corrinoid protein Co-methyltransferase
MASVIVGGKEELKRKPFIFHYAEPIPPLTHNGESVEKLFICADAGIPIVYMPYCMMGGTSPVSFAATLAQTNAEILSGLVIHQAKKEGAPFIVGNMPATFDMKTTIGTYGSPEFHMMVAAASELSHYYNLPFYGTCGCTDAKTMDHQTVMEATMNTFSSILSSPNVVHDPGFMDHGKSISPELVLLVNEVIDMLKLYRNGIPVNEETLAIEVIKEIGPGGHYLNSSHTRNNFKKIWYSEFMDRSMGDEIITVNEKINKKTREIIETYQPEFLTEDKLKDVKEIEKKWNKIIR